jgi:hypothetical protein
MTQEVIYPLVIKTSTKASRAWVDILVHGELMIRCEPTTNGRVYFQTYWNINKHGRRIKTRRVRIGATRYMECIKLAREILFPTQARESAVERPRYTDSEPLPDGTRIVIPEPLQPKVAPPSEQPSLF